MDETREQYLERIINGSTAYINVKEEKKKQQNKSLMITLVF